MQQTRDSSGGLWIIQAVSGLLLIAVLGLHLIAQHFIVEGGLRNYHQVMTYIASPLIIGIEIVFLVAVTTHALLGIRAILLDFGPSPHRKQWVNRVLIVAGVITIMYGIWLITMLQTRT